MINLNLQKTLEGIILERIPGQASSHLPRTKPGALPPVSIMGRTTRPGQLVLPVFCQTRLLASIIIHPRCFDISGLVPLSRCYSLTAHPLQCNAVVAMYPLKPLSHCSSKTGQCCLVALMWLSARDCHKPSSFFFSFYHDALTTHLFCLCVHRVFKRNLNSEINFVVVPYVLRIICACVFILYGEFGNLVDSKCKWIVPVHSRGLDLQWLVGVWTRKNNYFTSRS